LATEITAHGRKAQGLQFGGSAEKHYTAGTRRDEAATKAIHRKGREGREGKQKIEPQ